MLCSIFLQSIQYLGQVHINIHLELKIKPLMLQLVEDSYSAQATATTQHTEFPLDILYNKSIPHISNMSLFQGQVKV